MDPFSVQYYNAFLPNNTANYALASFKEFRSDAVLNDPSSFSLAVERFYVPAGAIPIFFYNQPDYVVSINFGGTTWTITIPYISYGTTVYAEPSIFSVYQFLDMVNAAILSLYNTNLVPLANPLFPAGGEPFITFDRTGRFFSLNFLNNSWTPNNPVGATLYFGTKLYTYFHGVPAIRTPVLPPTPLAWQMISVNFKGINLVTIGANVYVRMTQDFPSLWQWSDIASIILMSTTINSTMESINNLLGNSTNNNESIITDFEPLVDNDFYTDNVFQYFPSGSLRFHDINAPNPLKQLEFKFYIKLKNGQKIDLYIPPYSFLSFRLKFAAKSKIVYD